MTSKAIKSISIAFLATILLCVSCRRISNGVIEYFSKYFIVSYSNIMRFELIQSTTDKMVITVTCAGKALTPIDDPISFDSIANRHHDTNYNRTYVTADAPSLRFSSDAYPRANISDIISLTVTCDTMWDDQHPAGEPLNDIVELTTYSYRQYINSGYDDNLFPGADFPQNRKPNGMLTEQTMLLSEMQVSDFDLTMHETSYLRFLIKPTKPGTYPIKMTVELDNGRHIVSECKMVFQ